MKNMVLWYMVYGIISWKATTKCNIKMENILEKRRIKVEKKRR